MTINDLIKFAVQNHASDLHISGNETPQLRVNGTLRQVNVPPLTEEEVAVMIYDTMDDELKKKYEENWDIDYSYNLDGVARCRVNSFVGTRGPCSSFRLIGASVIPWDSLGLPSNIRDLAFKEKGLVLITGPAGCGKSTTMTSFIDIINQNRAAHILTVEDPVEFIHTPSKSLITHRQIGENTRSFASALKGALREDPDVILVGEMRDRETIQLALTAAETGHLVVSTLHTNNAPRTIGRIINAFSAKDQDQIRTMLSEGLLAVVSQVLVPRRDNTGVIPAFEILIATSTVRSMIRANKLHEIPNAIETGMKYNMKNMQAALSDLVEEGICWRKDCENHCENPGVLPLDPEFAQENTENGLNTLANNQEAEQQQPQAQTQQQPSGQLAEENQVKTEASTPEAETLNSGGEKSMVEQMYEEQQVKEPEVNAMTKQEIGTQTENQSGE